MYDKLFERLENGWSFQDIWEAGTDLDYVTSKARVIENLDKAVHEGNVDGFFLWWETEMGLEELWEKGVEAFNEAQEGEFRYRMTYHQFKTMLKNNIKEMTIMEMPDLAQNLFQGSADEFKST